MTDSTSSPQADNQGTIEDFQAQSRQKRGNIFSEFWDFLKHNKKWWLLPILIVLLLLGLIVILGGTAVAPFIYPLF